MYASELKDASRERLVHDLENLFADIQLFLSASAGEASESYENALDKLGSALDVARSRIKDAQRHIAETTRDATRASDAYAHENAWTMVGVAAVTGLVAGLLVTRH